MNGISPSNLSKETAARLSELSELIRSTPGDEQALIERGRLYWALGLRKEAMTDYLAAQRINPDGAASQLLEAADAILNFYHRDLYNP